MVTPLTGGLRAMVPVGVAAARTLDRPVVGIAATPDGGVGATFPSERRILALTQVHRVLLLSLEFAPNEHVNGALKKEQEFIPARDASPLSRTCGDSTERTPTRRPSKGHELHRRTLRIGLRPATRDKDPGARDRRVVGR